MRRLVHARLNLMPLRFRGDDGGSRQLGGSEPLPNVGYAVFARS